MSSIFFFFFEAAQMQCTLSSRIGTQVRHFPATNHAMTITAMHGNSACTFPARNLLCMGEQKS